LYHGTGLNREVVTKMQNDVLLSLVDENIIPADTDLAYGDCFSYALDPLNGGKVKFLSGDQEILYHESALAHLVASLAKQALHVCGNEYYAFIDEDQDQEQDHATEDGGSSDVDMEPDALRDDPHTDPSRLELNIDDCACNIAMGRAETDLNLVAFKKYHDLIGDYPAWLPVIMLSANKPAHKMLKKAIAIVNKALGYPAWRDPIMTYHLTGIAASHKQNVMMRMPNERVKKLCLALCEFGCQVTGDTKRYESILEDRAHDGYFLEIGKLFAMNALETAHYLAAQNRGQLSKLGFRYADEFGDFRVIGSNKGSLVWDFRITVDQYEAMMANMARFAENASEYGRLGSHEDKVRAGRLGGLAGSHDDKVRAARLGGFSGGFSGGRHDPGVVAAWKVLVAARESGDPARIDAATEAWVAAKTKRAATRLSRHPTNSAYKQEEMPKPVPPEGIICYACHHPLDDEERDTFTINAHLRFSCYC
jgi:hypothetical protein